MRSLMMVIVWRCLCLLQAGLRWADAPEPEPALAAAAVSQGPEAGDVWPACTAAEARGRQQVRRAVINYRFMCRCTVTPRFSDTVGDTQGVDESNYDTNVVVLGGI